ncbi:MAG: sulfurtransferase [Rhodoferax sp.]
MPTPYSTLISAEQLQALLRDSTQRVVVFDCSFELTQPEAGAAQYAGQHIAGAQYVHLDTDLSAKGDPATSGAINGGRHPLPSRERFAQWLGARGVDKATQVVVYDRQGVNYCGRLWWMLQWLGHEAVTVLDGGLQAWVAAGGAVGTGARAQPAPRTFVPGEPRVRLLDVATVQQRLGHATQHVLDARGAPRFRGEVEPLDPRAGHIPGALNRPFTSNFAADGRFKDAATLRAEFGTLLGPRDSAHLVHHCGSGVSAVPNLLALRVAGMDEGALFAGSWSEWCADPARPVAQD